MNSTRLAAKLAVVVLGLVVFIKFVFVIEMLFAFLAVVVFIALDVMLYEIVLRCKVDIA